MHYYSHHIGDLIRDTANLDDHQLATYMRMIWAYYQSEKPFTNELEDIAFAMRSDEKTVRLLLRHYFKLDGDVWRHSRCDKEIANYHSKSEKASKSAKTRWTKTDSVPADSGSNANASPKDAGASKSDANQEPRTKNHINKEKKAQAPSVPVSVLIEKGFDDSTAAEFIAHKQKMKAPLTVRAWADHLAESLKAGWSPVAAAEKVMAKNWKGFEAKYVLGEAKPSNRAEPTEPAWRREQRERMANAVPGIAAKSIFNKQFIDVEATNVTAIALGG